MNTHKVNPLTTWQFNYLLVKKILTPNPSAHGDVALDWAWKFHPRVSFIEGMPEKWLFSCAGKTIWFWASPLYVLRPCVTLLLMYIFFNLFFSFSPAAIQVEITPTQGEISVGDSKFFLCEGKNDLENALWNTTWCNVTSYNNIEIIL